MNGMIDIIRTHVKVCLEMDRDNNLKNIKKEIEEGVLGGRYVYDVTGNYYYIVGASSTAEDYYYIAINEDREIHFLSCVGKLNVVDTLPPGMTTLDYLIRLDPQEIADDVKRYVNSTGKDVMFTKLIINGLQY